MRVDLTKPIGQEGYITYLSQGQIMSDNLNNANGKHDLLLAFVKTNSAGVTEYTDQRTIKSESSIPVVIDASLDTSSTNAIQNKAVANAINAISIGNGTLTIQKNGSNVQTFTANQSGNATANITVPTKTSDLSNDSGFSTKRGVNVARVLYNYSQYGGSVNWTATEDGIVFYFEAGAYTYLYIDNVAYTGSSEGNYGTMNGYPIKQGSVLRASAASENWACSLKVFAMK